MTRKPPAMTESMRIGDDEHVLGAVAMRRRRRRRRRSARITM
jgi:hypothetical protein